MTADVYTCEILAIGYGGKGQGDPVGVGLSLTFRLGNWLKV